MAPLPTMSLRAPTEHHRVIRDVATRLRADPLFLSALEALLAEQRQHAATPRNAGDDVLQDALRRIANLEEAATLSAEAAAIDALSHHNAMRNVLRRITDLETAMQIVLQRNAAPEPNRHGARADERPAAPPKGTPRNDPDAKAERKAWAAGVLALPGAQGKGRKALAELVAAATGLAINTIANVLGGNIPASVETREKIRRAVEAMAE